MEFLSFQLSVAQKFTQPSLRMKVALRLPLLLTAGSLQGFTYNSYLGVWFVSYFASMPIQFCKKI